MNRTVDVGSDGFLGSNNIGGFGYAIGAASGILLLITTITMVAYFCTRTLQPASSSSSTAMTRSNIRESPVLGNFIIDVGLDEATIQSYPKLLYLEAKIQKTDSTSTCCSICLADYKETDHLRMLPDCQHLFHQKCVDPWLRLNPACPVCRTSPLPTPLSTPLAEVVPLASRRDH